MMPNVEVTGAARLYRAASGGLMGWTPLFCWRTVCAAEAHWSWVSAPFNSEEESKMHATTVAVDLAKSVFQLAVADASWKVVETQRLTRT